MTDLTPTGAFASASQDPVIALVRHGETDWNFERRIQGRTEVPLNETGREQATTAGHELAALAPATPAGRWLGIRTSPLGRAMETAELIAPALDLPQADIDDDLLERYFGPAEGLEIAEIDERWPGHDIPGAESLEALADRAAAAMSRVLDTAPNTVVVAHGALLRSGLTALTGVDTPRIHNGQIWLLRRTPEGYIAEVAGSTDAANSVSATAAQR